MFLDPKIKADRAKADAELAEEIAALDLQERVSSRRSFLGTAGKALAIAGAGSVALPAGFTAVMLNQPQPKHLQGQDEDEHEQPSTVCSVTEPTEKIIIVPQADAPTLP